MKRETGALLRRAQRAILTGKILSVRGDTDFAAGQAYHALHCTVRALLLERGLRVGGRRAVQRAFGDYFVKTGTFAPDFYRWLLDAHDRRIVGDYSTEKPFTVADTRDSLARAQTFLLEARRHLSCVE
jgi:uncharacterized protein (UPF0332 family)